MKIIIEAAGGSSGGSNLGAQLVSLSQGVSSVTVTFTNTQTLGYIPLVTVVNTTDSSPIFLNPVVTAMTTTQMTVLFNASTDTANYSLSYMIVGAI